MSFENKKIILGICGGIAAYKSCDIIRQFIKLKANVECILTKSGAEFITPLTLQTLSRNKVYIDMFTPFNKWEINHMSLAQKADIILVAPATADIIARLAYGRANDLLTCTILASTANVLVCPSMNSNMFNHKATQNNIAVLKSYGYKFIMPEEGELACQEHGNGRLAKIDIIVSAVKEFFK
ncbi:MAG: phosphopantothenoylcysteine decarboxylase [Endomicrobium sp.]|jgi:phosphopantothenoylcysteine decarboxylase/phosphopantothenate--cysteine ligase|nr:phosphopantothenoylcysteine decarboxylase [Endomicrobium sp.]